MFWQSLLAHKRIVKWISGWMNVWIIVFMYINVQLVCGIIILNEILRNFFKIYIKTCTGMCSYMNKL